MMTLASLPDETSRLLKSLLIPLSGPDMCGVFSAITFSFLRNSFKEFSNYSRHAVQYLY